MQQRKGRFIEAIAEPFFKERTQRATWYEHVCKNCGQVIQLKESYRVEVWKKGKRFVFKKSHIICPQGSSVGERRGVTAEVVGSNPILEDHLDCMIPLF